MRKMLSKDDYTQSQKEINSENKLRKEEEEISKAFCKEVKDTFRDNRVTCLTLDDRLSPFLGFSSSDSPFSSEIEALFPIK